MRSLMRVVASAALAIPSALVAQSGGQNAAIVLELPASARALGVGNVGVALSDDDASIFYNPAQLQLAGTGASISVQRYLASSVLGAASIATRMAGGTVALGVQALNYGTEPELIPDPAYGGERGMPTGGTVSAADMVIGLGYGRSVGRFRLGAVAKTVRQSIAGEAGGTFAADLGASIDVGPSLTLALVAQHLGGDLSVAGSSAPLPRAIRFGAAMPFARGRSTNVQARLTGEVAAIANVDAQASGGAEVAWRVSKDEFLTVRIGGRSGGNGAAASRLTAGGGLTFGHLALDYGYQGFGDAGGATHRLGVRWWR